MHFFLYSTSEESIGIMKTSDFRLLTDLHVVGRPDYDFTTFTKCLSVYQEIFQFTFEVTIKGIQYK